MPLNRKRKRPPPDFTPEEYPDRDVTYFGAVYPGSKFVAGIWYFRDEDEQYCPFAYQESVEPDGPHLIGA
jgi:hypothetical protein